MIPIFKVTHFRNAMSTLLTPQQLFMLLGFFVYSEKSVFVPFQRLTFLGFDLDSVHMTVAHTAAKIKKLFASCNSLLQKTTPTIRLAAEVIGILDSNFPWPEYGPLHYRHLERDK